MIDIETQRHYKFALEDQARADMGLTVNDYKTLDDLLYLIFGKSEGQSFALGDLTVAIDDCVALLVQQRKTLTDGQASVLGVVIRFALANQITHLS